MIAADGTLTRLVTDPLTGTLLDYGRTRYNPPDTLRQFVITRGQTRNTAPTQPTGAHERHRTATSHTRDRVHRGTTDP